MRRVIPLVFVSLLGLYGAWANAEVEVLGLFKGAAYLKVDGRERLVKAGTSFQGVHVLAADAKKVRIRVNGREETLTVSQHISSSYTEVEQATVSIPTNNAQQEAIRDFLERQGIAAKQ